MINGADFFIHETSFVDEGCEIGSNTKVWHFTHIMKNSKIGSHCILGQNVMVAPNVCIGNGVKVQNNVSIYSGVTCEDDVFLGPSMVFTNVINPRSFIERKDEFKPTLVKKGASIGANATILCGIEIGKYALIGAGAVVTKSVPDYALIIGNSGKQIGWVSKAGIRLHFNNEGIAFCEQSNEKYQLQNNQLMLLEA